MHCGGALSPPNDVSPGTKRFRGPSQRNPERGGIDEGSSEPTEVSHVLPPTQLMMEALMHQLFYLIGLIVVILAVLGLVA